jgi:hypothetical protein
MSKTLQDHHNDGQRDGSNGTYNPPNGTIPTAIQELLGFDVSTNHAENDAYNKGYDNGRTGGK